jgi:hypothetical protein
MKICLMLMAAILVLAALGCSRPKAQAPRHPTVYQQVYGRSPPYAEELNAVQVKN